MIFEPMKLPRQFSSSLILYTLFYVKQKWVTCSPILTVIIFPIQPAIRTLLLLHTVQVYQEAPFFRSVVIDGIQFLMVVA